MQPGQRYSSLFSASHGDHHRQNVPAPALDAGAHQRRHPAFLSSHTGQLTNPPPALFGLFPGESEASWDTDAAAASPVDPPPAGS